MKYLKIFEDFRLNKGWVISALDDNELKDLYEYLISVNANPKIYKYDKQLHNEYKYKILYTDNENLKHRFLIGRSIQPKDIPFVIIPDIEKEKYIQMQLDAKKFNI